MKNNNLNSHIYVIYVCYMVTCCGAVDTTVTRWL